MKEGWEYKKLGEVCDFQGGSQPPKSEWSKVPRNGYVRMLQIRDFTQNATNYTEYVKISKSLKYCDEDDILIGRYGASVGKILTGLSGAYNVAIIKTIPKEFVDKHYLKFYFLSPYFQHNLLATSQHRAAQAGFSKEDIFDYKFFCPPLSEQQHIVEELDLLSSIIEKKKAQLNELDNLAQSLFYEMFGDPITNEKGWEMEKLGKLCTTSSGGTPSKSHIEYYEGGSIPWLRSGEVAQGFIFDTELFITEEGLKNSSAKYFPNDTVVVAMYGATVGQVGILKKEMTTNQAVCGIFPNKFYVPTFLMYFLKGMKPVYLKDAAGGAQPNISQGVIKNTLIPKVPLIIQQNFVDRIESIEHQKELIKQSIKEVETLFNSRMDDYFN